jgi:hypothetical protein
LLSIIGTLPREPGLNATALQSLPAGPYAALVVGAGLPSRKPILVDLR